MNRGKCEHEAEIVTMHGKNVEKDDQTIHFLMESIGTSKGVIVFCFVFLFCRESGENWLCVYLCVSLLTRTHLKICFLYLFFFFLSSFFFFFTLRIIVSS